MSPYGAPLLLVVIVVIVIVAVMVSLRRPAKADKRRLGDGPAPIKLNGRGTLSSKTLDFPAGEYRADYRFSDQWATAVYLVSATTGDKDMLLYKTGAGSVPFTVTADERAVLAIEPTAEQAEWEIEIRPTRALPGSE